jgi:hypothetical protein
LSEVCRETAVQDNKELAGKLYGALLLLGRVQVAYGSLVVTLPLSGEEAENCSSRSRASKRILDDFRFGGSLRGRRWRCRDELRGR